MIPELEKLVEAGILKAYKHSTVNSDGVVDAQSPTENTEQLWLEFPNGQHLTIGSYCTVLTHDTGLFVK